MRYQYTYRTTAMDLWQLSMYHIYGSMVGVCNIIFTVAIFSLMAVKWNTSNDFIKLLLILGCCLFTVLQPFFIYRKAKKQATNITQDTQICFDDSGIHIKLGEKSSTINWSAIKRVSKKPTMVVVFSNTTHGFVLTNKVLGDERAAFYGYIVSKIKQ